MHSENKLLVSLGINDLIIIYRRCNFVANKNESQNIKQIVEVKIKKFKEASNHKKVIARGFYLSILDDKRWQVKLSK